MAEVGTKEKRINESTVRIVRGDITDLEVEAFVYYATEDLALGSGYGGAIAVRGGPSIEKELKELAPVSPCEAVVTAAGKMKAKHIVHAVGPKFQEEDTEGRLRTTISNALKCADEKGIEQIAFPTMGAGFYGMPVDLCARVMFESISDHLKGATKIKEVVVCVPEWNWLPAFESSLERLS